MRAGKADWEEFCSWIVKTYKDLWENESAYQTVLKERKELERECKKKEVQREKEFLDQWDQRVEQMRSEAEGKRRWEEEKRHEMAKKTKEASLEEKLQGETERDEKKRRRLSEGSKRAPNSVLKKMLRS